MNLQAINLNSNTSDLDNKEIFAQNLQRYMNENGMSRIELAQMIKVPYSTLSEWLTAKKYPRIDKIQKLASVFGIEKSELIEGSPSFNIVSGEKLRAVRNRANLTIEELVTVFNDKFGLRANKGMVSKWENDLVEPSLLYVTAYAKLFSIDLNELLNLPQSTAIADIRDNLLSESHGRVDEKSEKAKIDTKLFVATKIREYRKLHGLTQRELGNKIGTKHNTISGYESGTSEPELDLLFKIATVFEISVGDLFPPTTAARAIPDDPNIFIPKFKKVPLPEVTSTKEPVFSQQYFEGYVGTAENADFCLRVNGDSMIGMGICDGDTVFVKSKEEAKSGQVVVVRINGEAVTLKRFYRNGASVILQSENPAYPPMIFNANNHDDFRILGIAIIKQSIIK